MVWVFRWPVPPLDVLVPLLSSQADSPGPPAASEQEKFVETDCPTAYVPPETGEAIDADGAAGTVTVRVVRAVAPPLQKAVWPVKISVVEHPASSVTVSVAV